MTMFPQGRERTRAIGLYTAVSIGGSAVGLIAGGMLSRVGLLALGAVRQRPDRRACPRRSPGWCCRETPRQPGRFDLAGAAHLDARHGRARLRLRARGHRRLGDAGTIGSFAVGSCCCSPPSSSPSCGPSRRSRRCGCSPTATAASSYVARLLLVAGMMGMFFFLTQFLRGVLGYSDLKTGFAFVPLTVDGVRVLAAVARGCSSTASGPHRLMIGGITLLDARHAVADPAVRDKRLPVARRAAAGLRPGQRAGLRAADDRLARRRRPGGRRRGVGAGERDAAGRRLARPGRAGHRVRHREQARGRAPARRRERRRRWPGTRSSWAPTAPSGRRRSSSPATLLLVHASRSGRPTGSRPPTSSTSSRSALVEA